MRWGVSWTALTLLVPMALGESLRTTRTEIEWTGILPKKSRIDEAEVPGVAKNSPLLVYIESDLKSKEQERFDNVVDSIDSFRLTTKFFECVKIRHADTKRAAFLEGLKFSAPAIIVFSSDRKRYAIAKGKVSAKKACAAMRKIGQSDYKTSFNKTIQKATILLGRYDQIDSAQTSIDVKTRRWSDAASKGEKAKAKALRKDIDKDIATRAKYLKETDELWKKLWTLKRKVKK